MAKRALEETPTTSIVSEEDLKELKEVMHIPKKFQTCYHEELLVLVKMNLQTTMSKYKQEEFSNMLIATPGFPSFVMYQVNAPGKYSIFAIRRIEEPGTYLVHIADGKSQADSRKCRYWVDESRVLDFVVQGFIPGNTAIMKMVAVQCADSWISV